ncbi:Gfo/Idh/MocA family oxidoreductase [bacterium]|jgi:hypothetical protein|nr:Gfo/Idh/MocA family oxidoreductase [bacterium]
MIKQNKFNILVVGLGNIGSRYIQGLLGARNFEFIFHIVEPSYQNYTKSLKTINFEQQNKHIAKHIQLDELEKKYDFIFITTSAAPRAKIIIDIASRTKANFWIIEKNLAQSLHQLQSIEDVLKYEQVWVNMPRRVSPFYTKLKEQIIDRQKTSAELISANLDLGCNAIHFIDIFSWLNSSKLKNIEVSAKSGWFQAKRIGYYEFMGKLDCHYDNGSNLIIDNTKNDLHDKYEIRAEKDIYILEENKGIYVNEKFMPEKNLMQSEIMEGIICRIIENKDKCGLPTLQEALHEHILFFNAILRNKLLETSDGILKIT